LRTGKWANGHFGHRTRVTGKTVGVVGLGRIGFLIAQRLEGAGLNPLYHTRKLRAEAPWPHIADLEKLAQRSDYLVLAVPGGDATNDLIDEKILRALGPQSFLINVSRGSVINEEALILALQDGLIAGAALDVFQNEPAPDPRFGKLDNIILAPHVSAITEDFSLELANEIGRLVRQNLHVN